MRNRSGFGWIEFITGVCMILLGIFSLTSPGSMFASLTILYGVIAIITGVCDIVFYIKAERYTGFGPVVALVCGILSVMAGVMLLTHPEAGVWAASILFPLWFITHCVSRLSHLDLIRITAGTFYFYFSLVVNVLGLILGASMMFEPVFTIFAAGVLIGIYLILSGIESIVLAFSEMGSGW